MVHISDAISQSFTLRNIRSRYWGCESTLVLRGGSSHVWYTRVHRMLSKVGVHQVLVVQLPVWSLLPRNMGRLPHVSGLVGCGPTRFTMGSLLHLKLFEM